jgi:NADPH:quinone reductase-like Zn-dependent oxidoreductase
VRAAVLHELGIPRAEEFMNPEAGDGQAVLDVLAAGLNPVDVAICAGRFYAGAPPLPSVAGREGVGVLDGRRVYFDAPILPFGSMAQRALIDPDAVYDVPDGVADGVAVALGISGLAAWLALSWRAELRPGEHVLVLGASGVLGQVAVQAAKSLGAARVVAAARSQEGLQRCLELGADAAVLLDGSEQVSERLTEAGEGRLDVIVDPLFGEPFAAALQAASFGARIVQVGAAAGAESTVSSAPIRGKMLVVLGHTNFAAPREVKHDAYARLTELAAAGQLRIEFEPFELERVREAWERLARGSHRKIVLVPPQV